MDILDNLSANGSLDISCLRLTALDGIESHPNWPNVKVINCSYNYVTSIPN